MLEFNREVLSQKGTSESINNHVRLNVKSTGSGFGAKIRLVDRATWEKGGGSAQLRCGWHIMFVSIKFSVHMLCACR